MAYDLPLMAKRDRFFKDTPVTIQVNDRVLEYLEDLAKTGLYGNTYPEAAKIVFSHGLKSLIETGAVTLKQHALPREED